MMPVKGSTSENIALVPADQINVAYLPGLVSPVRMTCVFLGDKKAQRKHLYLNHSCLQVFKPTTNALWRVLLGLLADVLLADVLSNAEQLHQNTSP